MLRSDAKQGLTIGLGMFAAVLFSASTIVAQAPPASGGTSAIAITSPADGAKVTLRFLIQGKVQDAKLSVYVLVKPVTTNGTWWVQPAPTLNSDGHWHVNAYFGDAEHGSGEDFKITALASPERGLLSEGQQLSTAELETRRQRPGVHSAIVQVSRE
ncbi:MAG: hypothetical protein HY699_03840 [Deltaproteobacteria bacterium]|nr:hypothetical protein [Deltaproteobacteria bacterium]